VVDAKQLLNPKKDLLLAKCMMPLLTSHHPDCKHYKDDYYTIGRAKICIGCSTSFPIAILVVALYLIFGNITQFPWYLYIGFGAFYGLFQLASIFDLNRHIVSKVLVKVAMGFGMGLITLGVFLMPIHIAFRIIIFIVGVSVTRVVGGFRLQKIEKKCRACPQYDGYYYCDGFREITNKLEKHGFKQK